MTEKQNPLPGYIELVSTGNAVLINTPARDLLTAEPSTYGMGEIVQLQTEIVGNLGTRNKFLSSLSRIRETASMHNTFLNEPEKYTLFHNICTMIPYYHMVSNTQEMEDRRTINSVIGRFIWETSKIWNVDPSTYAIPYLLSDISGGIERDTEHRVKRHQVLCETGWMLADIWHNLGNDRKTQGCNELLMWVISIPGSDQNAYLSLSMGMLARSFGVEDIYSDINSSF